MAYYTYYQTAQPSWGTSQYQFGPPPIPQYQPQPSWHGRDYYRAHAGSHDNTLFDYVWSKFRNVVTGTGVSKNEARQWWKRIYGGLVDPTTLFPREIGAAAGYEAFRCWEHHSSIYVQPLSDDREREKEALIGLATAEAVRLWTYTQRPRDKYGSMEASEVAAATASRLLARSYDYDSTYDNEHYYRGRRRSFSGMRYGTSFNVSDDEFYDDDDDDNAIRDADARHVRFDTSSRHGRRRSRHGRSSSYHRSSSPYTAGSAVGLSSSPVLYSSTTYDPALGRGVSAAYYPSASSTPYSYSQLSGTLPYTYAGSSVGLPPPPGAQYLSVPSATGTYRHHRTRSAGSYDAVRPTFRY